MRRWRAPGRVNLLGEHTDYNAGFALPIAIPAGVTAVVRPLDTPTVRVSSAQAPEAVEIETAALAPGGPVGWSAYPLGAVWALLSAPEVAGRPGVDLRRWGIAVHLDGDLPLGAGLSSSAAVVCSVAAALNDLWATGLDPMQIVAVGRRAENEFVGAATGGLDQMAVMLSVTDHALLLDLRSMTAEPIPLDLDAAGLALLVTDSRVVHRHVEGGYGAVRSRCLAAARQLGVSALRDLTLAEFAARGRALSDDAVRSAARHVVTENARVLAAVAVLRRGALDELGPIMDASHNSQRDDLGVSTDEVDLAVDTARACGALGSRLTGGGFGGCTITLARHGAIERICAQTSTAFRRRGYGEPRYWTVTPVGGAHRV